MPDQFELPESIRQRLGKSAKRSAGSSRSKGGTKDHLIRSLWALLDGETLVDLTGVEKSVLVCVAAWANWGNGEVRLTPSSVSKHTGHDERACRRAVASLVRAGILRVVRQGSDGRGNATLYAIEKQGRRRPETGAAPSLNRGGAAPTNKDDPRIIQGGAAGATPPDSSEAFAGGAE